MNPRAVSPVPTPCGTPPPCPHGWTHPGGDPWCCTAPEGTPTFCYSVICPTPTPTPAVVPTVSGTGFVVGVLLLLAVAMWRLR